MQKLMLISLNLFLLTGCQFWASDSTEVPAAETSTGDTVVIDFPADDGTAVTTEGYVKVDERVMLYANGELQPLLTEVTLANGGQVFLDGTVQLNDQTLIQLNDGDLITMDGTLMTDIDVGGAPVREPSQAMDDEATAAQYVAYRDGVIGNGEEALLFFHAAWCPTCRADNVKLEQWDAEGQIGRTVYKVDYDTANDLKIRYGVVSQHTYVHIDGEGNALEVVNVPTETQLRTLLDA